MFNFGLFSTHIPYIVIAVGYLLYFLSSIFNAHLSKVDDQQLSSNIESIKIVESTDNTSIAYNYFDYDHEFDFVDSDRKSDIALAFVVIPQLRNKEGTTQSPCFCFSLFPNPPPVV